MFEGGVLPDIFQRRQEIGAPQSIQQVEEAFVQQVEEKPVLSWNF